MFAALESALGDAGGAIEEGRVLVAVDETAGKHLGRAHEAAGLGIDGDDDDEDAVGGEVGAVAEDVLVHIADAKAVDIDVAGFDTAREAGFFLVDLEDVAIGEDEGVAFGHADALGKTRVGDEVAVLAVDGDEVLGLEDALDDLELVLAGVAADVDVLDAVVRTRAPCRKRLSTLRATACSFPGMALAERTTVSPSAMVMWRCVPLAMRVRALVGSPWLPVVMMARREGGVFFISSTPTIVPSGASR